MKGKLLSGRIYPIFFPMDKDDFVLNLGCGNGVQAVLYKGQYKEMVGIDVQEERLKKARQVIRDYEIKNFKIFCGNAERMDFLKEQKFDKALAIDLIEHAQNPDKVIKEINRLLKNKKGQLLITFPMMHDVYTGFISFVGKIILRRKKEMKKEWSPDGHNQRKKRKEWLSLLEENGFELIKSRATTMFPPLHYMFKIPRFWFSNKYMHAIDNFFCKLPFVKNFGQTLACVFRKK